MTDSHRTSIFSRREIALSLVLAASLAASAVCMLWFVGFRDDAALSAAGDHVLLALSLFVGVFAGALALALATFRFAPAAHIRALRVNPLRRLRLDWRPSSVLVAWAIVVVLWIPWFVFQFPTGMSNDTFEQLYEFQTGAPTYYYALGVTVPESFVDHHPVFDTLLYGAFQALGGALGSQDVGVFLFALLQSLVTALALAASCCYLDELGASKVARIVALAFVALFPFIPAYAMTMVKDSTFCAVFALYLLVYLRAWQTRGASLADRRELVLLIALTCLCMLTKKTGAIVCVASGAALLVWCRAARLRALASVLVSLAICYALVPALVYPAIGGVAPGGRQEAFGIMYQQVVTAQRDHGDLSGDELEAMNGVMNFELACEKWNSATVDPVKALAHYDVTRGQYVAFFRAYLSIGFRHPDSYASSVLSVAMPLVCPGVGMGYYGTPRQEQWRVQTFYDHDRSGDLDFEVGKPAQISAMSAPVQRAVYAVFDSDLGSLLFGVGMFGGWLPAFCLVLSLRGGRKYAVAFVPIAVSVLLLLVCPASPTRYVLPMIYAVPVMFGLMGQAVCGGLSLARRCTREPEGIFG